MPAGRTLRLEVTAPALVRWSSDGWANAQETNMIRTFAQIVLSGQRQPRWGEQALATQQVLDALLCSARQDGSVAVPMGIARPPKVVEFPPSAACSVRQTDHFVGSSSPSRS